MHVSRAGTLPLLHGNLPLVYAVAFVCDQLFMIRTHKAGFHLLLCSSLMVSRAQSGSVRRLLVGAQMVSEQPASVSVCRQRDRLSEHSSVR